MTKIAANTILKALRICSVFDPSITLASSNAWQGGRERERERERERGGEERIKRKKEPMGKRTGKGRRGREKRGNKQCQREKV